MNSLLFRLLREKPNMKNQLFDLLKEFVEGKKTKREGANEIVKNHVLWSMGAGLVPIPVLDLAAVSAVQLDMINKLCGLYGVDYSESLGKSVLAAVAGGTFARVGSSLIKALPGVGFLLGGLSMAVLAGASTYAIGQVFITHFESNGSMDDFNWEAWKRAYEEQFELGKEFAQKVQKEWEAEKDGKGSNSKGSAPTASVGVESDAVIAKLEKLNELKERGIITEEEFNAKKQSLLQQL